MSDATFALLAINEYKKEFIQKIENAIEVTNGEGEYFRGLRNGMRFCVSIIDGAEPEYE